MGWKLDDNARSGIHYLVLGVSVMAALALVNAALDQLHTPLGPNGSYGHGYLIDDDGDAMIVATTTRAERLVTGVMLAFVSAVLLASSFALVTRGRGPARYRWASIAGRTTFFFSFVYLMYAALYLPPREFIGMRDRMFIVWERDVIMNDLPWPKEKKVVLIPFAHVEKVVATVNEGTSGRVVHLITIDHAGAHLVVGRSAASPSEDSAAAIFASDRVSHLEAMMRRP